MKAALLVIIAAAQTSLAQGGAFATPHVVLDHGLRPTRVKLVSLSRDALTARSADGSLLTIPLGEVEAVLLNRPVPTRDVIGPNVSDRQHWLTLTDGRRFKGRLQFPAEPVPDQIVFASLALGPITVPLDTLSSLTLLRGAKPPIATTDDVLLLANGDRLEGFVDSIGESVTLSSKEPGKEPSTLAIASIDAISFASPSVRGAGPFVWTADETLAFESISIAAAGEVSLRLVGPDKSTKEFGTTVDTLVALAFDMSHLVPLAGLPILSSESLGERRWSPPATSRAESEFSIAQDIEIAGPAVVTWSLPPDAARVAGMASLPEGCRDWGDLTMTIAFSEQPAAGEGFSEHLTGATPASEFNLVVPPGAKSVRISVDAGPSGPIQDHVRLSRTLVLTAKK